MLVPGRNPRADVGLHRLHALVHPPPEQLVGQEPKPPLHLVDPRRTGRGEVQVEPGMPPKPGRDHRGLVGAVVVTDHMNIQPLGHRLVDRGQNRLNSTARCRRCSWPITVPSARLNAANKLVIPCRSSSWVRRSGIPGIIGSTGCERSNAWIWAFSSTHNTTALSGGLWYSPTTSTTFSTTSGSVDSLKVSARCGLSPNRRQIRPIVDLLNPDRSAIEFRDQWVASLGVSSSVATTTCSTCSTVIDGGRPGRGSSTSPSSRRCTNRPRHLPTVAGCTPNSAATCLFGVPSAHASTILQRCASAWDDFARRAQRASVSRSSAVSFSSAFGRPVLAIAASLTYLANLRRRTLGINNHGQITGTFIDAADIPNPDGTFDTGHGFVQDRRGHTTSFDAPGARITLPNGINDHGQITGAYVAGDGAASVHGFIRDRRGTITSFEVPFGRLHNVSDINNRGQIVGYYDQPDFAGGGGFLRDRDGTITPVTYPGAPYTLVHGLNDRGQLVGAYLEPGAAPNPDGTIPAGTVHGFVWERGRFTSFDVSGSIFTQAFGINNRGQVVGGYRD